MRRDCPVDANRFLYPDAANLPAMLYLYRERYATAYRRIVAAVKAVAPFFEDFVLEPLRLNPPELVNDGETTAPSKRIISEFPQYSGQKTSVGVELAACVGIDATRSLCTHFDRWLKTLESLGSPLTEGA